MDGCSRRGRLPGRRDPLQAGPARPARGSRAQPQPWWRSSLTGRHRPVPAAPACWPRRRCTGRTAVASAMTGSRVLDHVLSSHQFDRALLEAVFARARALEGVRDGRLGGRIMASLFYEPSTRTRLSFEAAMVRLGGAVIGTESAREFSSVIKGETLEDTVRMVSAYADVIVLRHDEAGAAARAASVADVPIVNAGDGPGEHPTQALLDLYTIDRELGRIEGLHVALCGDLRYGRTARSLALLLSLFPGARLSFIAPDVVQMRGDILALMDDRGVPYTVTDSLVDAMHDVDVLYQTRVQK